MEKNLWKKNLILIILVVLLAACPLIFVKEGEFGGSDDQAEQLITNIDSSYQPWFESLWEPPSGEVESLLFSLQAAIGAGIVCGYIGYLIGKNKGKKESINKKKIIADEDMFIICDNNKIKSCMGCFECWIKTPGKCKIRDGYENLAKLYSKSDKVVIISQCVYGSYSPFVKNVLDRTIPYLLPFFKFKNKEMHHIARNKTKFDLNVYFYGENLTQSEKMAAKEIVKANSVNLNTKNFKVSFLEDQGE